jgi:hypothetical protein
MRKPTVFTSKQFLSALVLISYVLLSTIFQSCQKTVETSMSEESAAKKNPRNPHDPPPPTPSFSFNCNAAIINGGFVAGSPTNATITVPYSNSPGGGYTAFTSQTVNGVTLTAPAGTLNVGSGSVVFTASGTPVSPGWYMIAIGVSGATGCVVVITVINPPPSGENCGDPGAAAGSIGCVTFTYRGQQVTYQTVRANDGKIWLQQNLGSPQVAFHQLDQASFGHYFQWGRWDDGHQDRNSPTITGGPSLLNPSNISSGYPNFIKGTTASTKWWGVGGLATDSWSGTEASSTNGKDPCAALGVGWRLPTAAEWQNISIQEDLFGTLAAYDSNLKLTSAGYRYSLDGGVIYENGDVGYYWTSTAADNSNAKVFFFDVNYNAGVVVSERGQGFNCRCLKD